MSRVLRSLFDGRTASDYEDDDPGMDDAEAAVTDAERFVAAVADWLDRREPA